MTIRKGVALVAGARGFIGANLCRALVDDGYELHALVRPEGGDSIRPLPDEATVHEVDLEQPSPVSAVLRAVEPSLLFNAAVYSAYHQDQRLSNVVRGNILTLTNLLEACAEVDFPRFVHLGSSLEYGRSSEAHRESDPIEASSLRGVTKAAATRLAMLAATRDRRPVIVLRPFSVYGPWEARHRLVPTAIRAAMAGDDLPLTGPGLRRDFVFVDDVVEACLRAAATEAVLGEVMNVGTGVETSNEQLVAEVGRVLGREIRVGTGAYPPHETDRPHWRADIAKVRRLLDWEPRHSLAEGIAQTADWVKLVDEREAS